MASSAAHHVLLLGGNGKIARLLTPLLLRRGWDVTSVIRSAEQVASVAALGGGGVAEGAAAGKLKVLVRSLEDVADTGGDEAEMKTRARAVIDEVAADYVVWSAGAGGKGAPSRTFAIDRDAASAFVRAAAERGSGVSRFLLVSYISSRREKPAWWSAAEWERAVRVNETTLKQYFEAKVAADGVLFEEARRRDAEGEGEGGGFVAIDLRPGTLTDAVGEGVELGRTKTWGTNVGRETTARVADLLLATEGIKSCALDLLAGDEEAAAAVERAVREEVTTFDGVTPGLY